MTGRQTGDRRPEAGSPVRTGARAAAFLLAAVVASGAVFLGAPPRFSAGTNGPEWLRNLLVTLTPLALLEAAVAVALGLLVASECLLRESPGLPGGRAASRTRLPLLLLAAFGLVQLVPLPRGVLSVVAPFSAQTYGALAASGDDALRPMSLWPAGTAHALFNLAGMLAASTVVFVLVRGERARRAAGLVLAFVAALACAEALHGLAATKVGDDRLLATFEKVSGRGRVTGTFIHGTMMAVWAGMGACAAMGLAAAAATRRGRAAAAAVAAVCAVAGLFTLSRLGWLGVAAGGMTTCVLIGVSLRRSGRTRGGNAMIGGALVLVLLAVVAMFAVAAFRERVDYLIAGSASAEPRIPIWRSTFDLFLAAPLVGTGLGSFGRAIHLTQSADSAQELWFAHSDPLNLLSDTGVIGALLGAWWLVATARRGLPSLRSDDFGTRSIAAGAYGASAVVLVASLGDFQTQFPVVAIPFAALFSIPAALASPAADDAREPRAWVLPGRALAAGAAALALFCAWLPLSACAQRWEDIADTGVTGANRAEALVAEARDVLARVPKSADPRRDLVLAEAKLREAGRADPLLDEAHLWTGLTALSLGQSRDDVFRALGRARRVARGRAQTNLVAGRVYLDLLGTTEAPFGPPGDGAVAALREAGEIEPKAFSAAWQACVERSMPLDVLRAITPDRSYAKSFLFDHLWSLSRRDEAMALLEEQLPRDPADEGVRRRLATAYRDLGRSSEGRRFFDRWGAVWPETE